MWNGIRLPAESYSDNSTISVCCKNRERTKFNEEEQQTTLVRRLVLEPGEVTSWHVDPFHRVTVIVRGEALAIEYRDGAAPERFEVHAGQTDWASPSEHEHRAVNVGAITYEEVSIFSLICPTLHLSPASNVFVGKTEGKWR
jgi:quercetin dioxygenase-like cupin family protein